MAKFKIVEETYAYKEYIVEAESFEEVEKRWEDFDSELETISDLTPWDICTDDVRLDYIVNEDTGETKYCI